MEVPSHVVERFANSPAVLKTFMPHQISGRAMGQAMVNDLQESQRIFEGLQLHQQVGSVIACAPCCCVHTFHCPPVCACQRTQGSSLDADDALPTCGSCSCKLLRYAGCKLKMWRVIVGCRCSHRSTITWCEGRKFGKYVQHCP